MLKTFRKFKSETYVNLYYRKLLKVNLSKQETDMLDKIEESSSLAEIMYLRNLVMERQINSNLYLAPKADQFDKSSRASPRPGRQDLIRGPLLGQAPARRSRRVVADGDVQRDQRHHLGQQQARHQPRQAQREDPRARRQVLLFARHRLGGQNAQTALRLPLLRQLHQKAIRDKVQRFCLRDGFLAVGPRAAPHEQVQF